MHSACKQSRWWVSLLACMVWAGQSRAADEKPAGSVPLKKVVLFSSGVGFFEHAAEVEGDAQVDLKFNVDDINDLLKSMVLQDLGGGRISTVSYGSQGPDHQDAQDVRHRPDAATRRWPTC